MGFACREKLAIKGVNLNAVIRAVFGWGGQRHKATNRQAEQASPPNPTKKSPNIKFNLSLLQPLFGDLVVCAPHDREDHALPIRWEPIFSADER